MPITLSKPAPIIWVEKQDFTGDTSSNDSHYGTSVAMTPDGTTAVVGAEHQNNVGKAYVLTRTGDVWTQQQELVGDGTSGGRFGFSVDISDDGTYIVVGQPHTLYGKIYLFTKSVGTYSETDNIGGPIDTGNRFGFSVAISGDGSEVAVGAPLYGGTSTGRFYAYSNSSGTLTFQAGVTGSSNAGRGSSVDLSYDGSIAVIGESRYNSLAGRASIFTRSGSTWTFKEFISSPDIQAGELYGVSVTIDNNGEYIAIGAVSETSGGSTAGAVYTYYPSGSPASWGNEQKLTVTGISSGDNVGRFIDISKDGLWLAVGSHRDDDTVTDAGSVITYSRSGTTWSEFQKVTFSSQTAFDWMGWSVAIDSEGHNLLAGMTQENQTATGRVIYFKKR